MSDAEKIKWFNDTVKWIDDNWGDADEALEAIDMCSDAPYDLFFDFIDQYKKVKNNE